MALALVLFAAAIVVPSAVSTPLPAEAVGVTQKVAVSLDGSCAATDAGEVWCWGARFGGRIGNGTGAGYGSPYDIATIPERAQTSGAVEVSNGTCARTAAGVVSCWGEAGTTDPDGEYSFQTPVPWGTTTPAARGFGLATDIEGRCALLTAGTVQCFGWNPFGQLGNGATLWRNAGAPAPIPHGTFSSGQAVDVVQLTDVVDIDSDQLFRTSCAVKSDGTAWCWGANLFGSLGDDGPATDGIDFRSESSPVQVGDITPEGTVHLTDALEIDDFCALRVGGKVSCWAYGRPAPVEIPFLEGATDVTQRAGLCGVMPDTTVRCLGSGALGDGIASGYREITIPDPEFVPDPSNPEEPAPPLTGAVEVDGPCIRFDDGTISCWGPRSLSGTNASATSFTQLLVPTKVIGFGGYLPEDELEITVSFSDNDITLERDAGGDVVPKSVDLTVTMTNTSDDDVSNVAVDEMLATTLERGATKAIVQTGGPTGAGTTIAEIPAGTSASVTYTFEVSGSGIFGVEALVRWPDPVTNATDRGFGEATVEVEVDDGFEVEMTGSLTDSPSVVEVSAVIRNVAGEDLTGISWESGGLVLDALTPGEPVSVVSGPTPPLPDELADGQQVTARWKIKIAEAGTVVFGLFGAGTTPSGPADTIEELSAGITDEALKAIDLERAAAAGVDQFLTRLQAQAKRHVDGQITANNVGTSASDALWKKEYDDFRRIGFGDTTASLMASGRLSKETFSTYFETFGSSFGSQIDKNGEQDGALYAKLYGILEDPAQRSALAARFTEIATRELGYIEAGLLDPNSPSTLADLSTSYNGLVSAGDQTAEAFGFAWDGQKELWRIEANQFFADPLAWAETTAQRDATQSADFVWYSMTGLAEEVVTVGAGTGARTLVRGAADTLGAGLDGFRAGRRVTSGSADMGSDAVGQAYRRQRAAEEAANSFDDIPYGTSVSREFLERTAGITPQDATRIQEIVAEIEDATGVDVEIVLRTAEPLSAGIDGVGKRAFTSEKAVGALDLLMGAPADMAGKASVFNPVPLSRAAVEAAEQLNPGFAAAYAKRFELQRKNFLDHASGNTRTQRIIRASEQYGGVTVLEQVPGATDLRRGVEFIEQLDDPAYMATRPDLSAADIAEIRNHPMQIRANIKAEPIGDGFTFTETAQRFENGRWVDLETKPIVSDYDVQAIKPADGQTWPDGARSKAMFIAKKELERLNRFGKHGWSESAHDLPSDLFDKAAEFIMESTHPRFADRVADDLARRFGVLADDLSARAARAEAKLADLTPAARVLREAEIDRWKAAASRFRNLTTKEAVLAKWKPGKKLVVFTTGRVSVGGGGGL